MAKREVKFFVRVYPTNDRDLVNFKIESNRKTLHVRAPYDQKKYNPKYVYWEFNTDGIFCNSCQEEVYREAIGDSIRRAVKGEGLTLLAYGPSTTGKSYTMTGLKGSFELRGIAPRVLSELFIIKRELQEVTTMAVYLSFLEFWGNNVYNLLTDPPSIVSIKRREAPMVKCNSEIQALRLLFDGESRRKFENGCTSCSTTVVTLHLDVLWLSQTDSHLLTKIHLVDTAGVEHISSKSRSDACQIMSNKAISGLDFLMANANLADRSDGISALFRQSQLTEFIGSALIKGNVKAIGHVRLTKDDLLGTLNALKFGSEIKKLPSPEIVYARKPNPIIQFQVLQDENRRLKDEILLNNLLKGQYTDQNVGQEELLHIKRLLRQYMQGKVDENSVLTVANTSIILPVLRTIYLQDVGELKKEVIELEEKTNLLKKAHSRPESTKSSSKFIRGSTGVSVRISRDASRMKSVNIRSTASKTHIGSGGASAPTDSSTYLALDAADDVKDAIWMEFFERNPKMDQHLKSLKYQLENSFREKEESGSQAIKLRCSLDRARVALEDARWQRKISVGDLVGPDGHEVQSEMEKLTTKDVDNLTKQLVSSRKLAAQSHAKYLEMAAMYNEFNESVNVEFQDYVTKTYTNILILPNLEDRPIPSPKISEFSISQNDAKEYDQARLVFEHLQSSHGRYMTIQSSPCNKETENQ